MANMKRTNSVISTMYHPIGNSKIKTAYCMFIGGLILVCLGAGLIVTTMTVRHPSAVHVDETSVLISGPTCLGLGLVVVILTGTDMCRYRKTQNNVESELNKVISSVNKPNARNLSDNGGLGQMTNPKISIVINKALF